MSEQVSTTLGDLSGRHIGGRVVFTVGGATYDATLKQVQHEANLSGCLRTLVVLCGPDDWRLVKTFASDLPCTTQPAPIADETNPQEERDE